MTTNPSLLDKDLVNRLCTKSQLVFGAKWKWRKLLDKTGASIIELETQLDNILSKRILNKSEGLNEVRGSTISSNDGRTENTTTETVDRNKT